MGAFFACRGRANLNLKKYYAALSDYKHAGHLGYQLSAVDFSRALKMFILTQGKYLNMLPDADRYSLIDDVFSLAAVDLQLSEANQNVVTTVDNWLKILGYVDRHIINSVSGIAYFDQQLISQKELFGKVLQQLISNLDSPLLERLQHWHHGISNHALKNYLQILLSICDEETLIDLLKKSNHYAAINEHYGQIYAQIYPVMKDVFDTRGDQIENVAVPFVFSDEDSGTQISINLSGFFNEKEDMIIKNLAMVIGKSFLSTINETFVIGGFFAAGANIKINILETILPYLLTAVVRTVKDSEASE
jgi:hypothetical protein